ncbi:MAG: hypothetical protein BAJALOKI2v1_960016 [Promethearchaeota archaeon]|nr:MAG: hypothetical protein BAJALOKI2v1_960016 [Candidatus Lokiarchaeota archaeon]
MKVKKFHFLSILIFIILLIPVIIPFHSYNQSIATRNRTSSTEPSEETTPGQEVVDYFRWLFYHDWNIGEPYEPEVDGTGFPQSRNIYGSSYIPFESEFITDYAEITPILSPNNSKSSIVDLIDSAEYTLDIEQMYIYNSLTEIVNAIIAANNRGVKVRIILGDDEDSKEFADNVGSLSNVEIKICTGNAPIYFEQHNKGIIIDNETVLISSINWSPTSINENREAGLIIKSTAVTNYYLSLFDHDWSVCFDYDPTEHLKASSLENSYIGTSNLLSSDNYLEPETFNGTMNMTVMASPDNCYGEVSKLLSNAEESIDISVYTLSSPYLLDIIRERLSQGVEVRLLLEFHPVSYYEQQYNQYAMNNLTVLGVESPDDPSTTYKAEGLWNSAEFTFQHCKYCIIDNKTLILSSGNWARSSCPKPQEDGDVDGNRDWWIAIYGGNPGDIDLNGDEDFIFEIPSFNVFFIIGSIGITVLIISTIELKKKTRSKK